jgi:hypothetical protein
MIPLATEFDADRFHFTQIDRQSDVACYRKRKIDGKAESFEVVIIQKRKAHTWPNGKTSPAHEAMPSSEQWGSAGWTYTERMAALHKVGEITQGRRSIQQETSVLRASQ